MAYALLPTHQILPQQPTKLSNTDDEYIQEISLFSSSQNNKNITEIYEQIAQKYEEPNDANPSHSLIFKFIYWLFHSNKKRMSQSSILSFYFSNNNNNIFKSVLGSAAMFLELGVLGDLHPPPHDNSKQYVTNNSSASIVETNDRKELVTYLAHLLKEGAVEAAQFYSTDSMRGAAVGDHVRVVAWNLPCYTVISVYRRWCLVKENEEICDSKWVLFGKFVLSDGEDKVEEDPLIHLVSDILPLPVEISGGGAPLLVSLLDGRVFFATIPMAWIREPLTRTASQEKSSHPPDHSTMNVPRIRLIPLSNFGYNQRALQSVLSMDTVHLGTKNDNSIGAQQHSFRFGVSGLTNEGKVIVALYQLTLLQFQRSRNTSIALGSLGAVKLPFYQSICRGVKSEAQNTQLDLDFFNLPVAPSQMSFSLTGKYLAVIDICNRLLVLDLSGNAPKNLCAKLPFKYISALQWRSATEILFISCNTVGIFSVQTERIVLKKQILTNSRISVLPQFNFITNQVDVTSILMKLDDNYFVFALEYLDPETAVTQLVTIPTFASRSNLDLSEQMLYYKENLNRGIKLARKYEIFTDRVKQVVWENYLLLEDLNSESNSSVDEDISKVAIQAVCSVENEDYVIKQGLQAASLDVINEAVARCKNIMSGKSFEDVDDVDDIVFMEGVEDGGSYQEILDNLERRRHQIYLLTTLCSNDSMNILFLMNLSPFELACSFASDSELDSLKLVFLYYADLLAFEKRLSILNRVPLITDITQLEEFFPYFGKKSEVPLELSFLSSGESVLSLAEMRAKYLPNDLNPPCQILSESIDCGKAVDIFSEWCTNRALEMERITGSLNDTLTLLQLAFSRVRHFHTSSVSKLKDLQNIFVLLDGLNKALILPVEYSLQTYEVEGVENLLKLLLISEEGNIKDSVSIKRNLERFIIPLIRKVTSIYNVEDILEFRRSIQKYLNDIVLWQLTHYDTKQTHLEFEDVLCSAQTICCLSSSKMRVPDRLIFEDIQLAQFFVILTLSINFSSSIDHPTVKRILALLWKAFAALPAFDIEVERQYEEYQVINEQLRMIERFLVYTEIVSSYHNPISLTKFTPMAVNLKDDSLVPKKWERILEISVKQLCQIVLGKISSSIKAGPKRVNTSGKILSSWTGKDKNDYSSTKNKECLVQLLIDVHEINKLSMIKSKSKLCALAENCIFGGLLELEAFEYFKETLTICYTFVDQPNVMLQVAKFFKGLICNSFGNMDRYSLLLNQSAVICEVDAKLEKSISVAKVLLDLGCDFTNFDATFDWDCLLLLRPERINESEVFVFIDAVCSSLNSQELFSDQCKIDLSHPLVRLVNLWGFECSHQHMRVLNKLIQASLHDHFQLSVDGCFELLNASSQLVSGDSSYSLLVNTLIEFGSSVKIICLKAAEETHDIQSAITICTSALSELSRLKVQDWRLYGTFLECYQQLESHLLFCPNKDVTKSIDEFTIQELVFKLRQNESRDVLNVPSSDRDVQDCFLSLSMKVMTLAFQSLPRHNLAFFDMNLVLDSIGYLLEHDEKPKQFGLLSKFLDDLLLFDTPGGHLPISQCNNCNEVSQRLLQLGFSENLVEIAISKATTFEGAVNYCMENSGKTILICNDLDSDMKDPVTIHKIRNLLIKCLKFIGQQQQDTVYNNVEIHGQSLSIKAQPINDDDKKLQLVSTRDDEFGWESDSIHSNDLNDKNNISNDAAPASTREASSTWMHNDSNYFVEEEEDGWSKEHSIEFSEEGDTDKIEKLQEDMETDNNDDAENMKKDEVMLPPQTLLIPYSTKESGRIESNEGGGDGWSDEESIDFSSDQQDREGGSVEDGRNSAISAQPEGGGGNSSKMLQEQSNDYECDPVPSAVLRVGKCTNDDVGSKDNYNPDHWGDEDSIVFSDDAVDNGEELIRNHQQKQVELQPVSVTSRQTLQKVDLLKYNSSSSLPQAAPKLKKSDFDRLDLIADGRRALQQARETRALARQESQKKMMETITSASSELVSNVDRDDMIRAARTLLASRKVDILVHKDAV